MRTGVFPVCSISLLRLKHNGLRLLFLGIDGLIWKNAMGGYDFAIVPSHVSFPDWGQFLP